MLIQLNTTQPTAHVLADIILLCLYSTILVDRGTIVPQDFLHTLRRNTVAFTVTVSAALHVAVILALPVVVPDCCLYPLALVRYSARAAARTGQKIPHADVSRAAFQT